MNATGTKVLDANVCAGVAVAVDNLNLHVWSKFIVTVQHVRHLRIICDSNSTLYAVISHSTTCASALWH